MSNQPAPATTRWTAAQTRAQFTSICWLRWRIFLNGFRRKGSTGELVARIIVLPIFFGLALLPCVGGAAGAYYCTVHGQYDRIALLLWATFALCQLLNIQLGQPGSTFDPTELIRFPMRVRTYTAIRLFFGMLAPANIVGTLISFCIWLGIVVAQPSLWFYAGIVLLVFALTNVLFSRMVFTWVDRWLSTRRAREVMTGLIFLFSMGIQYLNFAFNSAYGGHKHLQGAKLALLASLYHRVQPFVVYLPPQLSAQAIADGTQHALGSFVLHTAGCALFGIVFLAIFALRIRTEFRGESFSDAANATRTPAKTAASRLPASLVEARPPATRGLLPPIVAAVLGKEFLYLRRNVGLFYGLLMPIVFTFLFAARMAGHRAAPWIFPAAVAYSLLGLTPMSYNSFGLEGAGSQFYFLAPVRLGDVLLGKNLLQFALALFEFCAVYGIIAYAAGRPSLSIAATALLWAIGTVLCNTMLGNRRSITAPKKIAVGRVAGKQASQLSAFMGLGIMAASFSVAASLGAAAYFLHQLWTLVPAFALFAAVALFFYRRSLQSLDAFALAHREELFTELCKPD